LLDLRDSVADLDQYPRVCSGLKVQLSFLQARWSVDVPGCKVRCAMEAAEQVGGWRVGAVQLAQEVFRFLLAVESAGGNRTVGAAISKPGTRTAISLTARREMSGAAGVIPDAGEWLR
jgi:hypothetical protein